MSKDTKKPNAEIEKALKSLMVGFEKLKHEEKMQVLDRMMKWEAHKAKTQGGNWGKGFDNEGDLDDDSFG